MKNGHEAIVANAKDNNLEILKLVKFESVKQKLFMEASVIDGQRNIMNNGK